MDFLFFCDIQEKILYSFTESCKKLQKIIFLLQNLYILGLCYSQIIANYLLLVFFPKAWGKICISMWAFFVLCICNKGKCRNEIFLIFFLFLKFSILSTTNILRITYKDLFFHFIFNLKVTVLIISDGIDDIQSTFPARKSN